MAVSSRFRRGEEEFSVISLQHIDEVIAAGPYSDDWSSLAGMQIPDWFRDAKFGIFTHWGLYTVPEYSNEWYSRNMYIKGYPAYEHHIKTYGKQKDFGYKDFIKLFTAPHFDPDEWLDRFVDAGAKYYFPVAEHHDGFQMYSSELSRFNAVQMGPKRDIIGELRKATLQRGLHFAASNHRAEHWWFMGHGREFDSDITGDLKRGDFYWPAMPEPDNQDIYSTPAPTQEFLEDWMLRVCEFIDNYRPELLYFDWWVQHVSFKPYIRKVAAYYYNRGVEWGMKTAICYKEDGMAWGTGLFDVERGSAANPKWYPWQTDSSVARNSWCYTDSLDYKPVSEILVGLIDAVSKNGNMLLNVGPRADGSIAPHDAEILAVIGRWMRRYGEGIYGTRPWKAAGEGPTASVEGGFADLDASVWTSHDFRFTAKNGDVYAFQLAPKAGEEVVIKGFAEFEEKDRPLFHGQVKRVELLGQGGVPFTIDQAGMHLPPADPVDDLPVGYKIVIE